MGVDHRSSDVGVAQKFLSRANVVASLQDGSGERMSKSMRGRRLGNSSLEERPLKGALKCLVVHMVPPNFTTSLGTIETRSPFRLAERGSLSILEMAAVSVSGHKTLQMRKRYTHL